MKYVQPGGSGQSSMKYVQPGGSGQSSMNYMYNLVVQDNLKSCLKLQNRVCIYLIPRTSTGVRS